MSKPFEVEVDCGSATPVRFTLSEERIRSAGIKVQYALHDNTGDPDDRTRLWRAALTIARTIIERSEGGPVEIYDGPDVWIIPEASVRWVKLHDPESASSSRDVGFRMSGDQP